MPKVTTPRGIDELREAIAKAGPGGLTMVTPEEMDALRHFTLIPKIQSEKIIDDPNPPNAPPAGFRLSTEEVAAIHEAYMNPEQWPQERINAAVPMRVSGGMQAPAVGEGLGTPTKLICRGEEAEGFRRLLDNPGRQETTPPPTPQWSVQRELEARKAQTAQLAGSYATLERDFVAAQHRIVELEKRLLQAEDEAPRVHELEVALQRAHQVSRELAIELSRRPLAAIEHPVHANIERCRDSTALQRRINELEAQLAAEYRGRNATMSLSALDRERTRATTEIEHPTPANDTEKRVNDMIDDLSARKVSQPDRNRLRGAIDKADKPLAGRAGQDEGLGRAIGRTSGWRPL